jgi:PTS system nitrogen regulatory IIA component
LFEAIRARERLASTAIGGGLALPHLRNPLRLQIDRPLVALCFLEVAVDWYAPDHTPVTALAVVLASTVRAVLQLHSRALFALQDPGFRRAVLDASARDVLLAEAARVSLLQRPHPQEDEP